MTDKMNPARMHPQDPKPLFGRISDWNVTRASEESTHWPNVGVGRPQQVALQPKAFDLPFGREERLGPDNKIDCMER